MVYPYIFIDSSSLVNVSHKNSVSLRVLNTYSLKRFISCNSDNRVQTDIIIRNTCILWKKTMFYTKCYVEISIINIVLP